MSELDRIQSSLAPAQATESSTKAAPSATSATTPKFDDMLKGFLKDVNQMQNTADQSIQKMVSGQVKDVHQVMLAVEEAKVAFNMMLEIRNKTMDAYNNLINMRS
jgi:flagellar hook-basal body complex protein FliE